MWCDNRREPRYKISMIVVVVVTVAVTLVMTSIFSYFLSARRILI